MSETKPLKNGHNPPKIPSQSQGAIRMRRVRDRKRRGAVILQAEIQPAMIAALIECGWLNPLEKATSRSVMDAIGAIVHQSLAAGMTPARSAEMFVPVDQRTIEAAWVWAKPDAQPSVQNAGRAIGTAIKCAEQAGFGPAQYADRVKAMMGIN